MHAIRFEHELVATTKLVLFLNKNWMKIFFELNGLKISMKKYILQEGFETKKSSCLYKSNFEPLNRCTFDHCCYDKPI